MPLTSNEYQKQALRTDLSPEQYQAAAARSMKCIHALHAVLGLMTEVGEVADTLKKCIIYGQPFDSDNIFEEAGDIDWYLCKLGDSILAARSNIQQANIKKLSIRYPEKFTEELAKERLDKKVSDSRVVCVACGQDGHRVEQCPHMNVTNEVLKNITQ